MTLGTWLFTKLRGEVVGTDDQGNCYYQDKRVIAGRRRKRWVIYQGEVEASRVPPDWHGWLHYTTNTPPPDGRPAAQGLAEGSPAQSQRHRSRLPSARLDLGEQSRQAEAALRGVAPELSAERGGTGGPQYR